jgi:hypothetical protein
MKKEILFLIITFTFIYLAMSFIFMTFDPGNWGLIGRIAFVLNFAWISFMGLKNIDR